MATVQSIRTRASKKGQAPAAKDEAAQRPLTKKRAASRQDAIKDSEPVNRPPTKRQAAARQEVANDSASAKRPSAKQFRFGYLVHDVSRIRRTVMDQVGRPYGITRSQWSVLSELSRSGNDGMMQVDLARLMGVGKVTVGGLVDRLQASGHVERRADPSDRRAKRVFITDQGYEIIRLMITVSSKVNKRITKGVSAAEMEIVERALMRVKHNLKTILAEAAREGTFEEFGSQIPSVDFEEID